MNIPDQIEDMLYTVKLNTLQTGTMCRHCRFLYHEMCSAENLSACPAVRQAINLIEGCLWVMKPLTSDENDWLKPID